MFFQWNQRNRPFLSEAFCGNEESDWLLREAEVITITHLFSNQWHTAVSGEGVKGVVPMTQENQSEFTKMPQLIKVTITLLVNWIFLYRNFKIFGLPLGLPRYPTSGPLDRISKNPSIKPRVTPLGWPMQNFGQFGPVVSSIEGLRTKKWLRIL